MELRFLLLILITNVGTTYSAPLTRAECVDVDYSSRLGPVRSQKSSSWCWAMVASDLIGFQQGVTPSNQVSAIDVALSGLVMKSSELVKAGAATGDWATYSDARQKAFFLNYFESDRHKQKISNLAGFATLGVVAYNGRDKVCLESELPSTSSRSLLEIAPAPTFFPRPGKPGLLLSEKTRAMELDFIEGQLKKLGDDSQDLRSLSKLQREAFFCEENQCLLPPQTSPTLFEEFNQFVLRQTAQNARTHCRSGPRVKPMIVEPQNFKPEANSGSSEFAAKWLGEGSPISITFSADFLLDGWSPSGIMNSPHEAVVAGKRWNEKSGTCEFKVRNSWGRDCGYYREDLKNRCEGGNIWFTEAEFRETVRRVSRVK